MCQFIQLCAKMVEEELSGWETLVRVCRTCISPSASVFTSFIASDDGKAATEHSEICRLLVTVIHFPLVYSPYARNVRRNTPCSFSVSSLRTHKMEPSPASGIEDENEWSYTFTPPIFLHDNYQSCRMVTATYCIYDYRHTRKDNRTCLVQPDSVQLTVERSNNVFFRRM